MVFVLYLSYFSYSFVLRHFVNRTLVDAEGLFDQILWVIIGIK